MDVPKQPERELPRSIGVWGGAAIMIGVMIGSGIFKAPTVIADKLPNPPLVLSLWVFGGLISFCGALIWTELSTMFPQSGGLYVFLREAYGSAVAFVFGWTFCLITQPMAVAAMAIITAEHAFALLGKTSSAEPIYFAYENQVLACCLIVLLTFINVIGMKKGAGVAIVLTAMKTFALAAIVLIALVRMEGNVENFQASPLPVETTLLAALVAAMAQILWTFDGWSDTAAVAEEVREPGKKLPQVFIVGTLGITALYLAVNAVFFWMLPMQELQATDTVAPLIMERLLGSVGSIGVTVLIVIATLGSAQASIIVGSRVAFAQSRDGLLFSFLSKVHPTFKTPSYALWGQCLLSCVLLWYLKHFEKLAEGFVFTIMFFYCAAAISLFVFRVRRPDAERPFRCWGYPVIPIIFIVSLTGLIVLTSIDEKQNLLYILYILLGFPIYWGWKKFAKK